MNKKMFFISWILLSAITNMYAYANYNEDFSVDNSNNWVKYNYDANTSFTWNTTSGHLKGDILNTGNSGMGYYYYNFTVNQNDFINASVEVWHDYGSSGHNIQAGLIIINSTNITDFVMAYCRVNSTAGNNPCIEDDDTNRYTYEEYTITENEKIKILMYIENNKVYASFYNNTSLITTLNKTWDNFNNFYVGVVVIGDYRDNYGDFAFYDNFTINTKDYTIIVNNIIPTNNSIVYAIDGNVTLSANISCLHNFNVSYLLYENNTWETIKTWNNATNNTFITYLNISERNRQYTWKIYVVDFVNASNNKTLILKFTYGNKLPIMNISVEDGITTNESNYTFTINITDEDDEYLDYVRFYTNDELSYTNATKVKEWKNVNVSAYKVLSYTWNLKEGINYGFVKVNDGWNVTNSIIYTIIYEPDEDEEENETIPPPTNEVGFLEQYKLYITIGGIFIGFLLMNSKKYRPLGILSLFIGLAVGVYYYIYAPYLAEWVSGIVGGV